MAGRFLLPNWLDQRALTRREHPALVCEGRTVTFAELARGAALAAGRLRRLGVRRCDRVALLVGNRLEFVEVMHGATKLGAVLVPLDGRLSAVEIGRQLQDCGATLLCYERAARETVAALAPHGTLLRVCVDRESALGDPFIGEIAPRGGRYASAINLQALHTIVYTSGSSGRPKGVRLTCGNHFWSATGSGFNLGAHADDRWLACLPFCHVGGLSILLRSVIYGTTAVIHDRFDPAAVNRAIDTEGVTIISVVANMLQRMLDERGDRPYPSRLRCVLLGGGPAPPGLLEACAARSVPVVHTYGLTEAASQVTAAALQDPACKRGSAGRPLLTTEIRLVDDGRTVSCGEVGEIQVRGPTVSPGYVGSEAYPDRKAGWLATGDLGRLDDDGFLYVVGRRDDLIISGGENIHPAEVEAVLQTNPAVAEVCVVGLPDTRWGESVVACVRLREGAIVGADELREHARSALAGFKIPRHVFFVTDFPRTASGKIVRQRLRQEILADQRQARARE